MADVDPRSRYALLLAREIEPMLQGQGPDIQGAALAELVSLWLVGHAPKLRKRVLAQWLEAMNRLAEVNAGRRGQRR